MNCDRVKILPELVRVKQLLDSRYPSGERPQLWEERRAGCDRILCDDGRELRVCSDGGQSPPKKGWLIVLLGGDEDEGYQWTLYGIPSSV